MKNVKENKAITLIALVITIIVLLLLAGVSISMLSGQDGILTKAANAKQASNETQKNDGIKLSIQEALLNGDGNLDFSANGNLANVLNTQYGEGSYQGNGILKIGEEYYTITETGGVIKGNFKIGDTVTYSPSGTYIWNKDYSGSSVEESPVLSSEDGGEYRITIWKIFNINDDGTIDLISEMPTEETVNLRGYQGYNNAVKLLNDACNSLYGNEEKGITARSINIEDIESKISEEKLKEVYLSYENEKSKKKYGQQVDNIYEVNKNYPIIYAQEKLSVIDGIKNTTGLGMSEQINYVQPEKDADGILGRNSIATNIRPYQTYYNTTNIKTTKELFKGEGSGIDNINYNLIIPNEIINETVNYKSYWVASRCINVATNFCSFYVRRVDLGTIRSHSLCDSINQIDTASISIRPIVSINSDMLTKNEEDNLMINL